jgi:hypothetical protein
MSITEDMTMRDHHGVERCKVYYHAVGSRGGYQQMKMKRNAALG